jgi:hypothetical protein
MTENEKFYDDEIAPALLALSEKAKARGMSIVATVEYDPGERGTTRMLQPTCGLAMTMISHCAKMGENIDGYVMGLMRYCGEKGIDTSASMVINQLTGRRS